jgi:methionyl-tRNA formyltransferase
MLSINPSIGILNLHTGLSPYVKGGPNCTNWCIANQDFHLIGNTIMWIDKGIDTGNILTTEFTLINGNENLSELHLKVMEHAHNLYISAVKFLVKGKRQSVKQSDIADGVTFYTKQWNLKQKFKLVKNFSQLKKQFDKGDIIIKRKDIKTIEI